MKILHRYITGQLLRNLLVSMLIFVFLFTVFDFLDRIDNVLEEEVDFITAFQYFAYKIPLTISLMLPVGMLVATLFTVGILSKNSEFTAMRSAGLPVLWLARPIFIFAFALSVVSIFFNETVVPHTARRVREIYDFDIKKKDVKGKYSQANFWWRSRDSFFRAGAFDSRDNSLHDLTEIKVNKEFKITERVITEKAKWLNPSLGWSMQGVDRYQFKPDEPLQFSHYDILPLPIAETPASFYNTRADPHTMSYMQLKSFVEKQKENGLSVKSYLADLYAKISFPFVTLIVTLVAVPFALIPARSGSMATSFLAGLLVGFSYYAIHSFSIAIGRAELWPPLLAAWMANILLGGVALILNLGSESPT